MAAARSRLARAAGETPRFRACGPLVFGVCQEQAEKGPEPQNNPNNGLMLDFVFSCYD